MRKITALIIFLLLAEIGYAQDPDDPGIKDTVSFCDVEYYVSSEPPFSGTIKIEVWLYNDSNQIEGLTGIVLPLRWTGPVYFDSGSFLGSKIETLTYKDVSIDNTNKILIVDAVYSGAYYIIHGKGKLITLFGTVQDTGAFMLDTTRTKSIITCFSPVVAYCFSPVIKKLEFRIRPGSLIAGDVSQNSQVGLEDIIALVNYLYRGETFFVRQILDVNTDCVVNLVDLVFLVNYVLKSGPHPVFGCACY